MAQDTAPAHAPRAAEGQDATVYTPKIGRTGAMQPTHQAYRRSGTAKALVEAWPGCIGNHDKRHREPWKQLMTGEPAHSPGGSRLPSSGRKVYTVFSTVFCLSCCLLLV